MKGKLMNEKIRFSTVLGNFGNQPDRFVSSGYKDNKTLQEMFADAATIDDLSGLELVGTWHLNEQNVDLIKELKNKYRFEIPIVVVDTFAQKRWGGGSFTSIDPKLRKAAVEEVKKYMDIAAGMDCYMIDVWPGQDGYDYSFQADYTKDLKHLIDGLAECANHRSDVKIGLEYKPKEPRTHCYVSSVAKTLYLIDKIGKDNVGVVLDVGHALYAYENMAESVALCNMYGNKLFHLHLNDNYRLWDDDMMVGSVHLQEYLELLYWLKKTGYSGWYSLDIFPYREDGIGSARESISWLKEMIKAVDSVSYAEIEKTISGGDAVKSLALLRKMIFK
jgi:xylose isomerase